MSNLLSDKDTIVSELPSFNFLRFLSPPSMRSKQHSARNCKISFCSAAKCDKKTKTEAKLTWHPLTKYEGKLRAISAYLVNKYWKAPSRIFINGKHGTKSLPTK